MLENKRANAAYTRLLALVSVLKDDVIFQKGRKSGTQGVGQRVWETLLEVLQTELIIKHHDRRKEHLYIDCGLAVAIIALYRMNQDIEVSCLPDLLTHCFPSCTDSHSLNLCCLINQYTKDLIYSIF